MDVFGEKCCSICMEEKNHNDFITIIMPCLHTACSSCMDKMMNHGMNNCHICRGEIEGLLDSMGGEEVGGDEDGGEDMYMYNTMTVTYGNDGSATVDLTSDDIIEVGE